MSLCRTRANILKASADAALMVQSALGQRLHLAGLVLSSSMPYPTGPVETIVPDTWHETLQSSLLGPISLIQAFLPLVMSLIRWYLTAAPLSTIIQNHLPYPVHRPLVASALQCTTCYQSLGHLLPRPHLGP